MKPSQKELPKWADQIPEALWSDLSNRSPQQAAEAVGAIWDGATFEFSLVGVIIPSIPPVDELPRLDFPISRSAIRPGWCC